MPHDESTTLTSDALTFRAESVLLDVERATTLTWARWCRTLGFDPTAVDTRGGRSVRGIVTEHLARRHPHDDWTRSTHQEAVDATVRTFEYLAVAHADAVVQRAGVPVLLDALTAPTWGVVSASSRRIVDAWLTAAGIEPTVVVTGDRRAGTPPTAAALHSAAAAVLAHDTDAVLAVEGTAADAAGVAASGRPVLLVDRDGDVTHLGAAGFHHLDGRWRVSVPRSVGRVRFAGGVVAALAG